GYGGYLTSRSHRDDAAIVRPAVGEADRELAIVREHAAGADESVRAEDGVIVHERGAHGERIAVSVDAAATHDLAGIRPDDPIGPDAGGGLARRVVAVAHSAERDGTIPLDGLGTRQVDRPYDVIRLCRESIVDRHRSEGRDCDAEDDAGHGDRDDQLEQRESRIARSSLDYSSPQIHDFVYSADTIAHFDQMRRRIISTKSKCRHRGGTLSALGQSMKGAIE